MSTFMIIVLILIGILCIAAMELNKNTLLGPILIVAAVAEFIFIWPRLILGQPGYLKVVAWILFFVCVLIIFYISQGPEKDHPAVEGKDPRTTKVITIEQGRLIGVYTEDKKVEVYAGIPYAKPPVGDLRWKEPQDPEPWDDVFKADHFGPMSMQEQAPAIVSSLTQIAAYHDYKITTKDDHREKNSEDSLYLNVWKPVTEETGLPVLVYIHGGSLTSGQTWYADHSGEGLARKGVIVVSMAYRVGIFGFFADKDLKKESPFGTTGNYGLLDQIQALKWVQKNIAAFGGDPSNVTIAGESAGSVCVTALCTSPLARGLFQRAIGESSTMTAKKPAHSFRTLEEAYEAAEKTKEEWKASSLEALRAIPAKKLAKASKDHHHVTIDGYVLKETPYESYRKGWYNERQILHGYNKLEGQAFVLADPANMKNYRDKVRKIFKRHTDEVMELFPASNNAEAKQNWIDIFSAVFFTYGHYNWTRQALQNHIPVYEYYFTKENRRIGPNHAGEMIYFYHMIPKDSKLFDEADRKLSDTISDYIVNFVKTGDPNGEGLPEWRAQEDPTTVLELNETIAPVEERFLKLYEILDQVMEEDPLDL